VIQTLNADVVQTLNSNEKKIIFTQIWCVLLVLRFSYFW